AASFAAGIVGAVAQIPQETVHSCFGRETQWLGDPDVGNRSTTPAAPASTTARRRLGGRVTPNRLAFYIQNFKNNFTFRRGPEIVIEDRALRRILSLGFFRRERRAGKALRAQAYGCRRFVENRFGAGGLAIDLPQRRDVIQDPE